MSEQDEAKTGLNAERVRRLLDEVTPGSWSSIREGAVGNGDPRTAEVQICAGHEQDARAVFIIDGDGSAEWRANVKLAAAAPDLALWGLAQHERAEAAERHAQTLMLKRDAAWQLAQQRARERDAAEERLAETQHRLDDAESCMASLADQLATARAEARREALEEAARHVEAYVDGYARATGCHEQLVGFRDWSSRIASDLRIRALSPAREPVPAEPFASSSLERVISEAEPLMPEQRAALDSLLAKSAAPQQAAGGAGGVSFTDEVARLSWVGEQDATTPAACAACKWHSFPMQRSYAVCDHPDQQDKRRAVGSGPPPETCPLRTKKDVVTEHWAHPETGEEMRGLRGAGLTARAEAAGMRHAYSESLVEIMGPVTVWWTWDAVAGNLWEVRYCGGVAVSHLPCREHAMIAARAYLKARSDATAKTSDAAADEGGIACVHLGGCNRTDCETRCLDAKEKG